MIQVKSVTIPTLTGMKKRRAYIYLPDSYYDNPEQRFPVLYMFDGHNVFYDSDATYGKSWGMKEYMDYTNTPVIIAAIECNHGADNDRLKEYSPYTFEDPDLGRIPGKGKLYMEWLVNEFKPLMDKVYRTIPDRDHTMIAGSSMGGLMSFYAVLAYNHIFSRAACLSPSLHFAIKENMKQVKKAALDQNTIVYMDFGSEELYRRKKMIKEYGKIQTMLMERGVYLESRIVPHGEHCEASWEEQISFFMNTILYKMGELSWKESADDVPPASDNNDQTGSKENKVKNILNTVKHKIKR